MATYSRYTGTEYATIGTSLLLQDASTQSYSFGSDSPLLNIPDNDSALVDPADLRSSVLSIYDSVPFKETSGFIGIDNSNQNIKLPIYLGKRNYDSNEILDGSIIDIHDITIGNTKLDTDPDQNSTIVSFLTGTFSESYLESPKLGAEVVDYFGGQKRIDLYMESLTGDVSVLSKGVEDSDPGNNIVVNGVKYPSWQDSDPLMGGSASDNRTLIYSNGEMVWGDLIPVDPGYYGSTDSVVPIQGLETYVNGYSLDFTDDRMIPISIGGISIGTTFDNISIQNVLESLIYEYVPPTCELSLSDQSMLYSEVGSYPSIYLNYNIHKKTNDTMPISLTNMMPGQLSPITGESRIVSGTARGITIIPLEPTTSIFTISVSDGIGTNSASASIHGIYPYFYGFTASTDINTTILKWLNKKVDGKSTQDIDIFNNNIKLTDYFYFVTDFDYGPITSIYDPNGVDKLSIFQMTIVNLSSPTGLWTQKKYRVYYSSQITTYINQYTVGLHFRFVF